MILAELSGNVAARFVAEGKSLNSSYKIKNQYSKVRGFLALLIGLFLLALSWDRTECFPLSNSKISKLGFFGENCIRVWPMLLPFLSGFLGCYERISMNWGTIREIGRKRVRLISLFYTTAMLFIPAVISIFIFFERKGDSVSFGNLGWPLANIVVFGVLLSENYSDEKLSSSKDFRKEFLITFACTLVLELFYVPELSLSGLLLSGILLYVSVAELDPMYSNYLEMGLEKSESVSALTLKPIKHILSERKSRKIALFLLINTAYMVVEFSVGFMSNSLGLISDACHMLFDCAALAIGLYASYISRLPGNGQFNYGRGRFEVLSGYVNAVFLVLVGALIVLESLERILDPQEISTNSLLAVSVGGFVVNLIGLVFFHEEHHHAHGGSCSHGHADSEAHHHDDHKHDHEKHQKFISVDANSCSGHGHETQNHEHEHVPSHDPGRHSHDHSHCHENQKHDHGHVYSHGHDKDHSHDHTHDCTNDHHHHHPHDEQIFLSDDLSNHGNEQTSKTTAKNHHHHIDHNMEGIFLHVLADTLGSVGVIISTLLIKYKGWLVADPACSIFISVLIVSSVIPLLRNSAEVLLQRVPRAHEQDLFNAMKKITDMKEVRCVSRMHVWSLTNTEVVGTVHLHIESESQKESMKSIVSDLLRDAGIKDLTLQVESLR